MKLTPAGKAIALVALLIAALLAIKRFAPGVVSSIFPEAKVKESLVPPKADLPVINEPAAPATGGKAVALLTSMEAGCKDKPEVRFYLWAWNAQMGLMLATGGPQSAKGSLMCNQGVNLKLIREDDVSKMQAGLISFATDLKSGNANPAKGTHFVAIMGDGSATFLNDVNDKLKKLGSEYTAKVVGSCGYSRGEDKFMGPPEWKRNPRAAMGGFAAGVLRDGDWNIAQKWLGDNGLRNNPDEKTYDPDALNWVSAKDYIDAAQKYVAGYNETRPVVRKGKRTGENRKVAVQAAVTWTPGDVTIAQKKGGLVSIVSTREYSSQMPNVIIGIDKWMKSNRATVEGMLKAIFEAGDQIKSNPEALSKGAKISEVVYHETDADYAYWEKYFKVVVEKDRTGLMVELGGSSVNNLVDNQLLFGLVPGSANLFGATYKVFGDIVVAQYPELVASYPPVTEILDTSYVQALAKAKPADEPKAVARAKEEIKEEFKASSTSGSVVSRKSWQIQFDTGKATFTAAAQDQLNKLLRDLLVASSTVVEVHGHTDSKGQPDANMKLSESRAFAVKGWVQQKSPVNFPEGRVKIFAHGQTQPMAPNSTPEGMARNRRVEIVMRSLGQ